MIVEIRFRTDSFALQRVGGLICFPWSIRYRLFSSFLYAFSSTNGKVGITSVGRSRSLLSVTVTLCSVYDFCYFVNLLTLVYLWIFPSSKILFAVCYNFSHGPVALAIVLWRNSLVFHSKLNRREMKGTFHSALGLDKVTSLFIHM